MISICEAKELVKVCQIRTALKYGSTLPSTKYLTVDASNGHVTARVTNLEQMVIYNLKAEVQNKGIANLPVARTRQILAYEKGSVQVQNGLGKGSILSTKELNIKLTNYDMGEEVPVPANGDTLFAFPSGFQRRLKYAVCCVARDPSRPVLTGVLLSYDKDKKKLAAVSADGFRLVVVDTPFDYAGDSFQVIIPANCIDVVTRFMAGGIRFGYKENTCWFDNGQMRIISQLIQGNFPAYLSLFPVAPPAMTVTVSAPLLGQRLSQMQNANDFHSIVRMVQKDKMLKLSHKYEEEEEAEIYLPATFKGEGYIAFNPGYIIEATKLFAEMNLDVFSPSSPLRITGDTEGVMMLVMPMYVQW